MIGGVAAAPLAAWLVRYVTPPLLGASVGGLILITNARTLCDVYGVASGTRGLLYLALGSVWVAAAALVVRRQRRLGEPLFNRAPAFAAERAA